MKRLAFEAASCLALFFLFKWAGAPTWAASIGSIVCLQLIMIEVNTREATR